MKITPAIEHSLFALSLVAALFFAIALSMAIPGFKPILAEFGAQLPLFTVLVMNGFWVIWLLPLLVIAVWFLWPNRNARSIATLILGLGGAMLFTMICVIGVYLPLFQMGQAIGG